MILLSFIEIYLINKDINKYDFDVPNLNEDIIINDTNNIKNIIIIITLTSLIYLLLHQVNQSAIHGISSPFIFCVYNKILIGIMIVDIIISLFFISKYIINYGITFTQ